MNIVLNIKNFLKDQGLRWTGMLMKGKEKQFRLAKSADFENLDYVDLLLDFGADGNMAICVEIDLFNFKIHGESFDFGFSCYAGDNDKNLKLCEERDLKQEWIKFQKQNNGLVYLTAVRKKCEEEKAKISQQRETRVKQLTKKIEFLNRSINRVKNNAQEEIKSLEETIKTIEEM